MGPKSYTYINTPLKFLLYIIFGRYIQARVDLQINMPPLKAIFILYIHGHIGKVNYICKRTWTT